MEQNQTTAKTSPLGHSETSEANTEMITLLTQIKENLDRSNRRERRANWLLLVNSLGSIMIVAAIVFFAAVALPRINSVITEVNTVLSIIEDAKIDQVAKEIEGFAVTGAEALEAVSEAAGTLSSLDMDSLNEAIDELTTTAESFSTIDFSKMNKAIENLSSITSKMTKFFGIN